jgi:prepilin-type N-terminal cleavage/methylation domain-containing protein
MNGLSHNSGFSLIEVMVAILVLGIALAGLTRGVTAALVSNKESELQTAAAFVAAGQIETFRSEKMIVDGVTEGDCGSDLPAYQWTQTVSPGSTEGLHEVTVKILKADSGAAIYELSTMLFDPDYPGQDGDSGKTDHRKRDKHTKGRGAE